MKDPNFLGSLIGAAISGLIAIIIMKITIRHEKRLSKKKDMESLVKELKQLYYYVDGVYKRLNQFVSYKVGYDKGFNLTKNKDVNVLGNLSANSMLKKIEYDTNRELNKFLDNITNINRREFSVDIYNLYLFTVDLIEFELSYWWSEVGEDNDGFNHLKKGLEKLKTYREDIEKH